MGDPPGGRSVFHFQIDDDIIDEDDDDVIIRVGIHPILDNANVSAIAVTGAPSSLPMVVDLPSNCAKEAEKASVAIFPQVSDGESSEVDSYSNGDEDKNNSRRFV